MRPISFDWLAKNSKSFPTAPVMAERSAIDWLNSAVVVNAFFNPVTAPKAKKAPPSRRIDESVLVPCFSIRSRFFVALTTPDEST